MKRHFRIKQETASSKPVKIKKEPTAVQEEPVADVLSPPVSGKVKEEKHIKIEYEESMAALPKVCETYLVNFIFHRCVMKYFGGLDV